MGLKLGVLEAWGFFRRDLDEGLLAEMAYADDSESVAADSFLGFFNGGEAIGGDGEAGGEPG